MFVILELLPYLCHDNLNANSLEPVQLDLDPNCDTLKVFLREFFKEVYFEKKKSAQDKKHANLPSRQCHRFKRRNINNRNI